MAYATVAPRRGSHAHAARRLALLAMLATAAFGVVYWLGVRTVAGQRLDNALLEGQTYDRESSTSAAWNLLRSLTVGALFAATLATMAVPLARRRPRLALACGAIMGGALLSNEILKEYVLQRPVLVDAPVYLQQNSFPSGHVTAATAAALALVLAVPHRLRGMAAVGGAVFATLVGTATMRAAWHRLSDQIGSYFLVLAIAAAAAAALAVWRGTTAPAPLPARLQRQPPTGLLSTLTVGAVVTGIAGLVVSGATLLAASSQGNFDVNGTPSVDVAVFGFWLTVASAGVIGAAESAGRSTGSRLFGRATAWGLAAAGVTSLVGGSVALLATWHEVTIGYPGEVALLWAYRLAAFVGPGICLLAMALFLVAIGPTELDPREDEVVPPTGPPAASGPLGDHRPS